MKTEPYAFSIDTDTETIFLIFGGVIGADTFIEAGDAVTSDPRWENHYDCLCDLRATKNIVVGPKGVEQLVRYMIEQRKALYLQGKIAVLISRWTLAIVWDLVEFRFKSKHSELRVFDDEGKALGWLGLPKSTDIQKKATDTDR